MKKFLTGLMALTMIFVTGCSANKPDGAVAKIGEEYIKEEDVNKVLDDYKAIYGEEAFDENTEQGQQTLLQIKPKIVENLVDQKIAKKQAEKHKITVSDEDVKKELDSLKEQIGGEDAFKEQLKKEDLTEEVLKEKIKEQLESQKLFEKLAEVHKPTDEEVKEYYEKNKKDYIQYNADHILISTKDENNNALPEDKIKEKEKEAKAIYDEVKNGADFEKTAKEKSEDPSAKTNSGKLGNFLGSTMVSEFSEALSKMKEKEISEPVQTEFGYHIIRLNSKVEEWDKLDESVKSQVQEQISTKILQEKIQKEFEDTKEELGVTIY